MTAEQAVGWHAPAPADVFDAELDVSGDQCHLHVRGTIDAVSARLFRDDLVEALRTPSGSEVVIDLTEVVQLSAAGVRILAEVLAGEPQAPARVVASPGCRVLPVLDLWAVPYLLEPTSPETGPTPVGHGFHRLRILGGRR